MADQPSGIACSTGAYLLWGLFPLYFKAVATIPAPEMLAHRILWSLLFFWLITAVRRAWDPVGRALRSPRLLAILTLSAGLIAVNWGVFIWAVAAGRVLVWRRGDLELRLESNLAPAEAASAST